MLPLPSSSLLLPHGGGDRWTEEDATAIIVVSLLLNRNGDTLPQEGHRSNGRGTWDRQTPFLLGLDLFGVGFLL